MTIAVPVSTQASVVRDKAPGGGHWSRLPTKAKVGAIILGFFAVVAIIGPSLAPFNPAFSSPNPNVSLIGPNATYILGTTQSGQDVFSQLLTGIRLTMELGLLVGVAATALSVIVGVTSAFLGSWWDEILSLLANVVLVIPALPLLVVLLGYKPSGGQWPTIIVLSFLGWPWGARVIRAQTLAIRNRDFVAAARETGEKGWRIIIFDIVPNEISLIAASFVNTVLYAIAASVALAFIGVADLNSYSLGTMLYWAQSQSALSLGAWWWFVPPGLAVAFIGTGLVLLNYGIDELGNPRLRDLASGRRLGLGNWFPSDPTPVIRTTADRPEPSPPQYPQQRPAPNAERPVAAAGETR